MITAVVGAGGKTTLIHTLAEKYRSEGKKVFVTTTTHMYIEPDTLLTDCADSILRKLDEDGYAMAGTPCGEKIAALPQAVYEAVCAHADEVLVEADGSRHLPIKYPNETEPVIPPNADRIIVVCGLHALGKPAIDAAFRLENVKRCLNIRDDTPITPAHIQQLVQKGYVERLMEQYPEKEIRIHAAHDGTLYQRAVASALEAGIDVSIIKEAWFAPKPCLMICGAGHVALELAKLAANLDYRIRVIDSRPEFANRERFPEAEEVICDRFENLKDYLEPGGFYAVVTPGHQDDYTCVRTILGSSYRYLGMIGSRGKVAKTVSRLTEDGISQERIASIHAPIGLPIGAVTPGEIAVSILAEIIQEKNRISSASVSSELLQSKEHGVLCIIIEKTGSAPRGVGSMMLVTKDGQIDTIGGGPVEHAAITDAREDPTACIRTYQLNSSEGAKLGMICGGTNQVLFLPI